MRYQSRRYWIAVSVALGVIGAAGVVGGCSSAGKNGSTKVGKAPKGIDSYVKAVEAQNRGDSDQAISNALTATRINPDLIMARLMLGDLYREQGDYKNAATHYETLVELDPYAWSNFYKLGVSYQFLARLNDAARAYTKALVLNPDEPNTNMNLGLVYLYQGKPDDAVKFTERATVLDPGSAAAWSNLGVALDSRGEFARAEAAYRNSLDIDADNVTTMLNLGTNLIQQNKGREAVDIMAEVVKRQDSPLHRKRYGDALAKSGRSADAIAQYNRALKLDANYYQAMNEIGWTRIAEYKKDLELDDRKRDEAILMWSQSLTINPNQPKVAAAKQQWVGKN